MVHIAMIFREIFLNFSDFQEINFPVALSRFLLYNRLRDGALAQLGARHTGSVEVTGSNPVCSIERKPGSIVKSILPGFCFAKRGQKRDIIKRSRSGRYLLQMMPFTAFYR